MKLWCVLLLATASCFATTQAELIVNAPDKNRASDSDESPKDAVSSVAFVKVDETDAKIKADISTNTKNERSIRVEGDSFLLDGEPFRYVAGSLHYFRVPCEYWRDRLRKLRAAGLNAVSTYVEWSFHEAEEGQYDWSGDRDLVRFIQIAAEEKLHVLLRPGPYICAERDLGGLPYWLLSKYPNIKLRTNDANYMAEVKKWFEMLFQKMIPLLYANGGPIILVQVENEYGSYSACDKAYMTSLRDIMRGHVGSAALLYTTDGTLPRMIRCGSVNDTLTTIDFGTGTNPEFAFSTLRQFMPRGPLVNSEYYPGWLTHWGEEMPHVSSQSVVTTLRSMLNMNASVNFYVFFGGTNFEFTAGANWAAGMYMPDITSYDYDAPITESGKLTPKYEAIRSALQEYHPWVQDIPLPAPPVVAAYGTVKLTSLVGLLSPAGRDILGSGNKAVTGAVLPTFEELRQRAGLVLYETVVPDGAKHRLLHVAFPRDRVYVYLDGNLMGVLSRQNGITSLPLAVQPNTTLGLLVESQGRINFGEQLKDFKGIIGEVMLDTVLNGRWSILGYPLERLVIPKNASCGPDECPVTRGPVLYGGTFTIPDGQKAEDTFFDPSGWTKGYVWVNGHNLGRYWPTKGPQVTLYLPGSFLHEAPIPNLVQVLELESAASTHPDYTVDFVDHPIFRSQKKT